jgi:WD40 repeat protein
LFAALKPKERPIFREGSYAKFSPDGRVVVQTHEQGTYIWDSATGIVKTRIPFQKDSSDSVLNGFTPDGKMFATLQHTGGWHAQTTIEFRDCETGELRSTLTAPKWDDSPDQEFWSDDSRTFVAASGYKKYQARIWDIGTGRLKGTFPMLLTFSRIPFDFGFKDRDTLRIHPTLPIISAANDKFIRLWSAETGELLQLFDGPGGHGEWSADGKLFLRVMKDLKSVQVWDVVAPQSQAKVQ